MANLRANNVCGTGGRNAIDGSVIFNGDDYLSLAANTDFAMGTGAFTVECWIYTTDYSHAEGGYSQRVFDSNGGQLGWYITSDGTGLTGSLVSGTDERSTYKPGLNVWTHIALARSGTTLKAFVNGVEVDSTTNSGSVASSGAFIVGARSATEGAFKGYISNLRVIKGTALYTAAFTPPTEKLTVIDGTVLLCCQDSNDPTQEATGKTITGYGKLAAGQPIQHKKVPPVGIDEGVVFNGDVKINTPGHMYFPTGDTTQRGRGRAVFGGGGNPSALSRVDYITIQSTGNAVSFGSLTAARVELSACGSATRGVFCGGATPTRVNTLDYITFTTTGNATDFGDSLQVNSGSGSCGSDTRGIMMGGRTPTNLNTIQYLTFATTANTTDFGDLVAATRNTSACSSPTRGVQAGGTASNDTNTMEYITIASTGNATDFGDIVDARHGLTAWSSNTRGCYAAGYDGADKNIIEYITIATTGNTTDFGDLGAIKGWPGRFSNCVRGGVYGGWTPSSPSRTNTIEYVNIATTGNANDFGDTYSDGVNSGPGGCSDSGGGLTQ
jgi:hypothetical protein